MLEASVAAPFGHGAVSADRDRGLQGHLELSLGGEVVGQLGADALAVVAGGHAVEPEGGCRVDALGRIHAAQPGLDQDVGQLKPVDGFAPHLQHDRVAHPGGDARDSSRRVLDGRQQVGRAAIDRRRLGQVQEDAIGPYATRLQGDDDVAGLHPSAVHAEAVGEGGRHGGDPCADRILRIQVLPIVRDARLREAVGLQQHAALLRQDAVEIVASEVIPA